MSNYVLAYVLMPAIVILLGIVAVYLHQRTTSARR
jgi:hypothetical protein